MGIHRFLFLAAIAMVALVTVVYLWRYSGRGATSEEFWVYGALLNRFADDEHIRRNDVFLVRQTLELPDPEYPNWIPPELRSDRRQPPWEFVSFCGHVCGWDFVRKNLVVWTLTPNTADLGFSLVEEGNRSQIMTEQSDVAVTRVGFNVLRTRAVLSYASDCIMSACGKSGDAYLVKEHGVWRVDRY